MAIFCFGVNYACAETLKAGIEMDNYVPETFYGTWRVAAKLVRTDSHKLFKDSTIDLWNISKSDNVITLENPSTKASASITVTKADNKAVTFEKVTGNDTKKLYDRVELSMRNNSFDGVNYITVKTFSSDGKNVIKVETAKYSLYGEKISGFNAITGE
ncbi:hypothetical protein J6S88_07920 [bacterium]|nr:hypothetical protein [bacterium]